MQINATTSILIQELESDYRVPSIKFLLKLEFNNHACRMVLEADLWIECSVFDEFHSALKKNKYVVIKDFSEKFILSIDENKVSWEYIEGGGEGVVAIKGQEVIFESIRDKVISIMDGYPKWW